MADDNVTQWILDLDDSGFAQKVVDAISKVEKLGKALEDAVIPTTILAAAFAAVKVSLDLAEEAEKIKQINVTFENLTKNVGIAGEALRTDLVGAVKGLATDSEIISSANKAIIALGANADKLPQIMNLASKATSAFGGDLLANFEEFNHAIATGQTKSLKNFGIIVDQEKVYRKFAEANGIAANALSENAKQQAIMNAVLEVGAKKFDGVASGIQVATSNWVRFKVALSEVAEQSALAFDKMFGRQVATGMEMLANAARGVTRVIVENFGDAKEAQKAHTDKTKEEIDELEKKIKEFETTGQSFFNGTLIQKGTQLGSDSIAAMTAKIQKLKAEVNSAGGGEQFGPAAPTPDQMARSKGDKTSLVDPEANKKNIAQFQRDMSQLHQELTTAQIGYQTGIEQLETNHQLKVQQLHLQTKSKISQIKEDEKLTAQQKSDEIVLVKEVEQAKIRELEEQTRHHRVEAEIAAKQQIEALRSQNLQTTIATATSEEQVLAAHEQQKILIQQQAATQLEAIKENQKLTAQQKEAESDLVRQNAVLQQAQLEQQLEQQRSAALDNHLRQATDTADGVARAFEDSGRKQALVLNSYQAQGQRVFMSFQNNAVNALTAWGAGSKSASEAAKGFIFGVLADEAIARGTILMMSSIFPPNPIGFAAGAGLIAFGGFLRSQAGGKGGGLSGGAGGGGGAGGSDFGSLGGGVDRDREGLRTGQKEKEQKNLQIVVNGNYMETDQTRTRMAELVREAMDSTGFSIQKVGGGL